MKYTLIHLQPIRHYVYGPGMDDIEGHYDHTQGGPNPFNTSLSGWTSYTKDQVGTITHTVSHHSQQTTPITLDTFGNPITPGTTAPYGTNSTTASANTATPFGFQSKYRDPESGLYYFYHRYYHPANGRFLNEDPIGLSGGLNLYAFVNNNPVNFVDPWGLVTGGFYTRFHYVTLKNFHKLTGRVKYGATLPAKDRNLSGTCVQLDDGKWYPNFDLKVSLDILISTTDRTGSPRPTGDVSRTERHEIMHATHIGEAYQSILKDWTKAEKNGYSKKCDCENQVNRKIKKAMSSLKSKSSWSVFYVDWVLLFWPFDDITTIF